MAHHDDASQNKPVKELLTSLIGIVLFLVLVLGIGVSAWFRPGADHTPVTTSATEAGKALDAFNAETTKADTAQ